MTEYVMEYDGWAEGIPAGEYLKVCSAMHARKREEIVRCKDCAYMEQQTTYDGSMSWFLCTHFDRPTRRDGFCAWGGE